MAKQDLFNSLQSEVHPEKFKRQPKEVLIDNSVTDDRKGKRKMVSLPEEDWLRARAYAYEHQTTISAVISLAVKEFTSKEVKK